MLTIFREEGVKRALLFFVSLTKFENISYRSFLKIKALCIATWENEVRERERERDVRGTKTLSLLVVYRLDRTVVNIDVIFLNSEFRFDI